MKENTAELKKQLRKEISVIKKTIGKEEKINKSNQILEKIESLIFFRKAVNILFYHSLPDEVQTGRAIELWSHSKNIYLPVVDGDELRIRKYDKELLKKGSYDILEPQGEDLRDLSVIDLVIVPGVAFDKKGNRLGRGKGYYDRLLKNIKAVKIGICYDFQIADKIPADEHDVPLDGIICENEIFMTE